MASRGSGYQEANCPDSFRKYDIFVSGIPSKINAGQLKSLFSEKGSFQLISLNGQMLGPVQKGKAVIAGPHQGFCILRALDEASYERIINEPEISFFGRTLNISGYRSPIQQGSSSYLTNLKRVIVKKVPVAITTETLELHLSSLFGDIEKIYRFEAETVEKAARKALTRKTHTYSVIFRDQNSANQAAQQGSVQISETSSPIFIEKYNKPGDSAGGQFQMEKRPAHQTNQQSGKRSNQKRLHSSLSNNQARSVKRAQFGEQHKQMQQAAEPEMCHWISPSRADYSQYESRNSRIAGGNLSSDPFAGLVSDNLRFTIGWHTPRYYSRYPEEAFAQPLDLGDVQLPMNSKDETNNGTHSPAESAPQDGSSFISTEKQFKNCDKCVLAEVQTVSEITGKNSSQQ